MNEELETNKSKISSALVKAQKEFSPAIKDASNPHYKSKYADLNSCVKAVIDGLNNNGIFLTQKHHISNNGINIETILLHESGQSLSSGILFVPAEKQSPQGFGSAITYARRYSLMTMCGIAPQDDDAESAEKKLEEKQKENKEVKVISAQVNLEKELDKKINDELIKRNPDFKGLTYKEAAHKDPDQFGIWMNGILTRAKNQKDNEWKETNIKRAKAFLDYVVTISPKDEIPF